MKQSVDDAPYVHLMIFEANNPHIHRLPGTKTVFQMTEFHGSIHGLQGCGRSVCDLTADYSYDSIVFDLSTILDHSYVKMPLLQRVSNLFSCCLSAESVPENTAWATRWAKSRTQCSDGDNLTSFLGVPSNYDRAYDQGMKHGFRFSVSARNTRKHQIRVRIKDFDGNLIFERSYPQESWKLGTKEVLKTIVDSLVFDKEINRFKMPEHTGVLFR